TVAFRAPDSCLTQTAGRATGMTTNSGAILTTGCAVWLAEVERAVTLEGLRVISWDVLLRAERTGNGSIYEVAKKLGADLVFILNSLEAMAVKGGSDLALSISYYQSNPDGARLGDLPMTDEQRATLRFFMDEKVKLKDEMEVIRAVAVMLDTT